MARKRSQTKYPGVYKEPLANGDVSFYVQYRDENGGQVCALHGRKSRNKTARTASEWRTALIRGTAKTRQQKRDELKIQSARSIEKLYAEYIKDKKNAGKDSNLFKRWVLPYWQHIKIEQATDSDAAKYRKWLERQISAKGTPLSPQTVKHAIALFRRIVRYTKRHINGFTLLIDDFDVPTVFNEKTEDLDPEQLESLLKVLTSDYVPATGKNGKPYRCRVNRAVADIMLLILNSGMRRNEVLKLQWQQVNFTRKTILLKEPKGGKDVTIQMNDGARAVLKRQQKLNDNKKVLSVGETFVFPGKNGQKRRHIDVAARKIRDLAGLPKDWRPCHGLRHYYGTELAAQGTAIHVISEMLGHKNIGVTQRYMKVREQQKIDAAELMSLGGKE